MKNMNSVDNARVYIIDSDKAIVERINKLLLHRGIVTITDAVGNVYYMIDARDGAKAASKHITELVMSDGEETYTYGTIIHKVFAKHGFNSDHIGTMLLQYIVKERMTKDSVANDLKGEIYRAAKALNISDTSAIRDIRYAVNQSSYANEGIRTGKVLAALTYETNMIIQEAVVGYRSSEK